MSVHTDFFTATESQLAEVFVGWHTVSSTPVQRETTNPFTGEPLVVNDWKSGPPVKAGDVADIPGIEKLPHYLGKRIDHVKIGKLHELITGEIYEDIIDAIIKPALKHPDNEDMGLHKVPAGLTIALAVFNEAKRNEIAGAWQLTEECQLDQFTVEDCRHVVEELYRLAQESHRAQAAIYLFWSM